MTQKEFDDHMNEFRRLHAEEADPLKIELEILNQKNRTIGYEIQGLLAQKSAVIFQRDALRLRLREINAKYHKMKHDLIVANPKATPPTCKEHEPKEDYDTTD